MQGTLALGWFWLPSLSSKQALTVQTHPMTGLTWPRHASKYHGLFFNIKQRGDFKATGLSSPDRPQQGPAPAPALPGEMLAGVRG